MGPLGRGQWHITRVEQGFSEDQAQIDPQFSTGDPEDDQILQAIARKSDLSRPREWMFFLQCSTKAAARSVEIVATEVGFTVEVTAHRKGRSWSITARQSNVVISATLVRQTREFFQGLADRTPGVSYDGWHASV